MSQTVYVYATDREPDLRAVSALVSLGIQPTVLTVGLKKTDQRGWEYQVQRHLPEVTVLHSERNGLAFGYNTALAACKTEYIVYLSQDSVPTSQWWESLINEWRRVSENVAAIGGPITLPQLSKDLQSVYGGYEYGQQPRFLYAQKQTLLGNNISFRVCALKAVQGFWPTKGIPGGPNWFSEEHHLQRELAQLGWQLYYSPDLRMERYPKQSGWLASNLITARFHYGTRLAAIGQGQPRQKSARFFTKACVGNSSSFVEERQRIICNSCLQSQRKLWCTAG